MIPNNIRDRAFIYAYNSKVVKDTVERLTSFFPEARDDFYGFFYIQLGELKNGKLEKAYEEGWLDWLCVNIITKQLKSSTSLFYRQYRKNNNVELKYMPENEDEEYVDTPDAEFYKNKLDEVLKFVNKVHWYDREIFLLKYQKRMEVKDIVEHLGVNKSVIVYSLNKTRKFVRENFDKPIEQKKEPNFNRFLKKQRKWDKV